MNRYHKKIGFNIRHEKDLKSLNDSLNSKDWKYTQHCLNNLHIRFGDKQKILLFIKNLKLNENDIFEYYAINDKIQKVCYRLKYSNISDLIIVIGEFKQIITIYLNEKADNHYTLKEYLYCRP